MQSRIITSILVGSEWSHKTMPYINLKTGETSEVTLSYFLDRVLDDMLLRIFSNPLMMFGPSKFAEKEIFAIDTRYIQNCRSLRGFCNNILDAKRKQPSKQGDLIQILLEDSSYTNSEDIVDDIIVMFLAGSKTV